MDKSILEHQLSSYDYVKCNSTGKVRGNSERKFPRIWVPHRNTIQNHVNKVRTAGISINRKLKCPPQVLTEDRLDSIRAQIEHSLCPGKATKNLRVLRDRIMLTGVNGTREISSPSLPWNCTIICTSIAITYIMINKLIHFQTIIELYRVLIILPLFFIFCQPYSGFLNNFCYFTDFLVIFHFAVFECTD
jgi:hypothetical protein